MNVNVEAQLRREKFVLQLRAAVACTEPEARAAWAATVDRTYGLTISSPLSPAEILPWIQDRFFRRIYGGQSILKALSEMPQTPADVLAVMLLESATSLSARKLTSEELQVALKNGKRIDL